MYREDDRQNRISNGFPLPPGAVTRTLAYTYNNNIPNENTSLFLLFFFLTLSPAENRFPFETDSHFRAFIPVRLAVGWGGEIAVKNRLYI